MGGMDKYLFTSGEVADSTYFVIDGTLDYAKDVHSMGFSCRREGDALEESDNVEHCRIPAGSCFCEQVLWIAVWTHQGDLVASTNCELLRLRASQFQSAVNNIPEARRAATKYAESFSHQLKVAAENGSACFVDDLWPRQSMIFQELADEAFSQVQRGTPGSPERFDS